MFHQLLTPLGSLALSSLVAALPVGTVLVMLGIFRRPSWQGAAAGLVVAFGLAVTVWQMPARLAADAIANGGVFALWPVMWIVLSAVLLYNIAVASGRFDAFCAWMVRHMPDDRRVALVVIGFCFGALMEGVAGFGAPVAITTAALVNLGFAPLEAIVFVLICNTAPVAFGALGTPVTVLATVTGLPVGALAAMIGRQLPVMALLLPFYAIGVYGGLRSVKALWPMLLVAGGSFAAAQFLTSNYVSYTLTDVIAALASVGATIGFLQVWQPRPDPAFAIVRKPAVDGAVIPPWQGWLPWLTASAVVIVWTYLQIPLNGQNKIAWPGLHNAVAMTLYGGKPYAAIWTFEPLGTGTAILIAAILTALACRVSAATFAACTVTTLRQLAQPIVTVMLIVGLAYVMNYSGEAYTLGEGLASTGRLFIVLSPLLGWVAVLLSGSDTSGNALFGSLQVAAARQLDLSPVLIAATNSSGGVLGKMVAPQNITTGLAVTELAGHEGIVFARTLPHSLILTLLLGALVAAQQFLTPWVIPAVLAP